MSVLWQGVSLRGVQCLPAVRIARPVCECAKHGWLGQCQNFRCA